MKKTITALFIGLVACFAFAGCASGAITIELYSGTERHAVKSVTTGKTYELGTAERTGYRFLGWYDAETGGSALTDAAGSSAGMTWSSENPNKLYANWDANRYKITFDYHGATGQDSVKDVEVVYGQEIISRFPVPLKSGNSFRGWFTAERNGVQVTNPNGTFTDQGKVYDAAVYPFSENGTKLHALWGDKTITFQFQSDGSTVNSETYTVGTTLQSLPASFKNNMCFESWCRDSTFLDPILFPLTLTETMGESMILYAKFAEGTNDLLRFDTISATGDREYEVSYSGSAKRIVIPDLYFDKKVTRVRRIEDASLTHILLPQSVTQFSVGAFEGCGALEKINLPAKIDSIPERCFTGCASLTEIQIPQTVNNIGKNAFGGCTSIAEMELPKALSAIGAGAFRNMSKLTSFSLVENLNFEVSEGVLYRSIGNSRYLVQYPAAKKADTFCLDARTTKILEYAFSGASIRNLSLEGKVSSVGEGAFEGCKRLVSLSISGGAYTFSFGKNAFAGCSNLRALKIELESISTIDETSLVGVSETFSVYVPSVQLRSYQTATNWRNIKSQIFSLGSIYGDFAMEEIADGCIIRQYFGTDSIVEIPKILNARNVVGIANNAFAFSEVKSIIIPEFVQSIGAGAFKNCASLSSIVLRCEPPVLAADAFVGLPMDFAIYIDNTPEVLLSYRNAVGWSDYSDKIWSYQS